MILFYFILAQLVFIPLFVIYVLTDKRKAASKRQAETQNWEDIELSDLPHGIISSEYYNGEKRDQRSRR